LFASRSDYVCKLQQVGIAIASSTYLKSRQSEAFDLDNPKFVSQLQVIRARAVVLAVSSQDLRSEATKLLTRSNQMDFLAAVQLSCDRVVELPSKIDLLAQRLHGSDSLLSVNELRKQLDEVRQKLGSSSGVAKQHLAQLEGSLTRNLNLAQEGQDTREAQLLSLSILVQDSAGVLQRLQNQLRTASFSDLHQLEKLLSLNDELNSLQENFDLLTRQ
jgi:hypothetical protein